MHKVKKKKKPAKQDKKHEKHHPEERLVLPVQCTSSLATKFPPVKPLGGGFLSWRPQGPRGPPPEHVPHSLIENLGNARYPAPLSPPMEQRTATCPAPNAGVSCL